MPCISVAQCKPNSSQTLFVELCAGTASLSCHVQAWGISVLPVDYDRNRFNSKLPIIKIDLTQPVQVSLVLELIQNGTVDIVAAAPPCGTASRAREIPLPDGTGPVPLRNAEFPRGIPGLSDFNQHKVHKANQVYDNVFLLLSATLDQGKGILVENPANSWMWHLPEYASLLSRDCFDILFQNCKWTVNEPARNKWTRVRTNIQHLQKLDGPCLLSHTHLPWGFSQSGGFATADEAAYPKGMCVAFAASIASYLNDNGKGPFTLQDVPSIDSLPKHKRRRLAAANQPRGRKVPSLLSEYDAVLTLPADTQISDWHKLLRYNFEGGEHGTSSALPVVGVFRSPEKYVQEALQLKHPVDRHDSIPDVLLNSIRYHFERSPDQIAKERVVAIRNIIKLVHD